MTRTMWLALVAAVAALASAGEADALKERAARLLQAARDKDTFVVVQELNESKNIGESIALYSLLVDGAYQGEKDVALMNQLGRCAIEYLLSKAAALEGKEAATKLRIQARAMSYNLAANNWPGWGEPGLIHDPSALSEGLDFARLSLRLVLELKEDDERQGNAHWIVGALLLAQRRYERAADAFKAAAEKYTLIKKDDLHWMAVGYEGLTAKLAGSSGAGKFEEALKKLEGLATDDAKFFRDQLKKAHQIFTTRFVR